MFVGVDSETVFDFVVTATGTVGCQLSPRYFRFGGGYGDVGEEDDLGFGSELALAAKAQPEEERTQPRGCGMQIRS